MSRSTRPAGLVAALAALVMTVGLAMGGDLATAAALRTTTGSAAAAVRTTTDPVQAAAGWLTTQFVDASHLPTPNGDHVNYDPFQGSYSPNYGVDADAVFGLAAAKAGGSKISVLVDYLLANIGTYADLGKKFGGPFDGSIAKAALAAMVAGVDATPLLTRLKADECTAASKTCPATGAAAGLLPFGSSISESFVILAEARSGGRLKPSHAAITYVLSLQCASGGFTALTTACGSGPADVDATAYAVMALAALRGHKSARGRAADWLAAQRTAAGYWVSQGGPNADSTGLATAALAGVGKDVSTSRAWLRGQQIGAGAPGAGAIRYGGTFTPTSLKTTSPSVLATAQALPALVDGGSLATVTATGAVADTALFAPVASLSSASVVPGGRQSVTGHGFVAGERVQALLLPTRLMLGTALVTPDGAVTLTYLLPASVEPGSHSVELTGSSSSLRTVSALSVQAAPAPAAVTTAPLSAIAPTPVVQAPTLTTEAPALAATGNDGRTLLWLGVLGAGALVAGCGVLALARRRAG